MSRQSPLMAPRTLPEPLQPGDRVTVIAPSGALPFPEAIAAGVEIWRSRGFEVTIAAGCDRRWGYLAGTDGQRRDQLMAALGDSRCRAIVCARGGYGAARLLEDWDWPLFAGRGSALALGNAIAPKWLVGFSDVTALLWSLAKQGVAGVHGPLLTTLPEEPEPLRDRLFDLLMGRAIAPLTGEGWGGGAVVGPLLPANLTVATHLLQTRSQPSLEGAILAFEDVTEAPYRIDRLLTQWRSTGALGAVAGVALGRFSQCDPPRDRPSLTVEEVLRDRLGDLGIPVVSGLPFGHDGPNAALPVGTLARLDGDQGILDCLP
ncbi:MAG: LD-carboxypeptidase [Cyanophyceae cyanobacterium]